MFTKEKIVKIIDEEKVKELESKIRQKDMDFASDKHCGQTM